jgi:predicted cation transporter
MTDQGIWIIAGSGLVMGLVLLLPFFSKKAEEELEAFLFIMGVMAVSISGLWSWSLVIDTLRSPLPITLTVLAAGSLFYFFQDRIKDWIHLFIEKVGVRFSLFLLVTDLGFLSGFLSSIITPLILSEVLLVLRLHRELKVKIAVLSCLSIGLGAVLTPLGGPLTAIAVEKLKGEPYHADFFFMARLMGPWIIPTIVLLGLVAAFYPFPEGEPALSPERYKPETVRRMIARTFKIYLFVIGLSLLAAGLTPIADRFLASFSPFTLYWINMSSAALDNATLAAIEIDPTLSLKMIQYLLIGLLVSGVMLIPGNLPNIITANKLGIKSGEWARLAFPLGLALMTVYFVLLMIWG